MTGPFDPQSSGLPVADSLPELLGALEHRHAVLVAEPGAGKTTLVPPALLSAPWLAGRIVLLEPRRVVARAAAARIATLLGATVGGLVGTRMRMDVRVSNATRIEVVTEGVFARMALDDPELTGVGAVIFDEYHERSLDADFGLALGLDIARSLRPDLRLMVMSATIDAQAVATLMDDAAVIRSKGRTYPVTVDYRPLPPRVSVERAVADAVRSTAASTLAFLPGRAEVERTVAALGELEGASILPLHGGLDASAQDRAVRPRNAERKIVIATPIAESSLTIDGVDCVVDSGLVREPVYDIATGITRLETRRASIASVDQRAGRAGRTGPGWAIRLWAEAATRALPAHAPPEILRSDLSQLLLDCLDWGVEPSALSWIDPPPPPVLAAARTLLLNLGAVDDRTDGTLAISPLGRAMRDLPLPPRLAFAVLQSEPGKERQRAAAFALLSSERGLGGDVTDLRERERLWRRDTSPRGKASRDMAAGWARSGSAWTGSLNCERAFASAYSDRIAHARGPVRPDGRRAYLLSSGRGAFLDAADPLAREDWLVVIDLTGQAREQRIVAGLPIQRADVEKGLRDQIEERDAVSLRDGRVEAVRERALGSIVLDRRAIPQSKVDADAVAEAFADAIRSHGIARLPWEGEADRLRSRLAWLRSRNTDHWPDVADGALAADLEEWLLPHLPNATRMDAITPTILRDALLGSVPWDKRKALDDLAPERFVAPTGTRVPITYPSDGSAPRIAIRVQELFGMDRHPLLAGEPLLLDLLSPARSPIQTTSDLSGFWRGSWADVRRDMRARYPRHPWPEEPWLAEATTRAKPRP